MESVFFIGLMVAAVFGVMTLIMLIPTDDPRTDKSLALWVLAGFTIGGLVMAGYAWLEMV